MCATASCRPCCMSDQDRVAQSLSIGQQALLSVQARRQHQIRQQKHLWSPPLPALPSKYKQQALQLWQLSEPYRLQLWPQLLQNASRRHLVRKVQVEWWPRLLMKSRHLVQVSSVPETECRHPPAAHAYSTSSNAFLLAIHTR